MKIHKMRLHNNNFDLIKCGSKTIEIRLYDEKRRTINVGDIIEFENRITLEIIKTEVVNLYVFDNFSELFRSFDKVVLGYGVYEDANSYDMEQYYSKEEQDKYEVLAIEIKLI